jgi:hypothetical protein
MNENMNEKNENNIIINNNNNNSTFKKLQEIQVLVKKESGLKELCMYYIKILFYIIYIV